MCCLNCLVARSKECDTCMHSLALQFDNLLQSCARFNSINRCRNGIGKTGAKNARQGRTTHSILAWAQDCPGVTQKTLEAQCCTALRPQTRRPDCPKNYGSALLHSRTLTENSVSVLLCSSLPPGFTASNLASNAKEMGKIKRFLRQNTAANSPRTPWCHWFRARAFSSGRQNRAKPWL